MNVLLICVVPLLLLLLLLLLFLFLFLLFLLLMILLLLLLLLLPLLLLLLLLLLLFCCRPVSRVKGPCTSPWTRPVEVVRQKALGFLEEMRYGGLQPNAITFNALISAWEKG